MTPEIKREFFYDNYYALLAGYVAGTLNSAENMIVASHLTLKPEARNITRRLETIAGTLLARDTQPEPLANDCLDNVLARLDEQPAGGKSQNTTDEDFTSYTSDIDFALPRPVLRCLSQSGQRLKWKRAMKGIERASLPTDNSHKSEILKISPGIGVPAHTHEGEEITLLLDGSFDDETGHYERGDLIVLDERTEHHPVSHAEHGCVCLTVSANPIRMTGPILRLLNPFLK